MKKLMILFAAMFVISMQEPILAQIKISPAKSVKSFSKFVTGKNIGHVFGSKGFKVEVLPNIPTARQNRWVTPVVPLVDTSACFHSRISSHAAETLRVMQAHKLEPHAPALLQTAGVMPTIRPSFVEIENRDNNFLIIQPLQNENKTAQLDYMVFRYRQASNVPNPITPMTNYGFRVKLLDDSTSCILNNANRTFIINKKTGH